MALGDSRALLTRRAWNIRTTHGRCLIMQAAATVANRLNRDETDHNKEANGHCTSPEPGYCVCEFFAGMGQEFLSAEYPNHAERASQEGRCRAAESCNLQLNEEEPCRTRGTKVTDSKRRFGSPECCLCNDNVGAENEGVLETIVKEHESHGPKDQDPVGVLDSVQDTRESLVPRLLRVKCRGYTGSKTTNGWVDGAHDQQEVLLSRGWCQDMNWRQGARFEGCFGLVDGKDTLSRSDRHGVEKTHKVSGESNGDNDPKFVPINKKRDCDENMKVIDSIDSIDTLRETVGMAGMDLPVELLNGNAEPEFIPPKVKDDWQVDDDLDE